EAAAQAGPVADEQHADDELSHRGERHAARERDRVGLERRAPARERAVGGVGDDDAERDRAPGVAQRPGGVLVEDILLSAGARCGTRNRCSVTWAIAKKRRPTRSVPRS